MSEALSRPANRSGRPLAGRPSSNAIAISALGAIVPIPDGYRIVDEDLLDDIANGDLSVSPRHPVNAQPSTMTP